jgi:DNA-binding beta-propeller fold protein YncE
MRRAVIVVCLIAWLAPATRAEKRLPDTERTLSKASNWIKQNNRFGPDDQLVADVRRLLARDLSRFNDLTLTFGPGLMKSGKVQRLEVRAGQLFVFQLSDRQARHLGLARKEWIYSQGTQLRDLREAPAPVRLTRLTLDGGKKLDGSKPLSGQVSCRVAPPPGKKVALRLSFSLRRATHSLFYYPKDDLTQQTKTIRFSFDAIEDGKQAPYSGPLVLFVDLCLVNDRGSTIETTILSNTRAVLVDVAGRPTTLRGHKKAIGALAFSPDGKTLASGGLEGTIKLWNTRTAKARTTLAGHVQGITALVFAPDGKTLASASSDRTIKLWDVKTGKEQATLEGHTAGVLALAYRPDGKLLASGSRDGTVRLWDVAARKCLATLTGSKDQLAVAFSPDGKTLAAVDGHQESDDRLKFWDVGTRKRLGGFKGVGLGLLCLAYTPDGKTLVLGGGHREGLIQLYDLGTSKKRGPFVVHPKLVRPIALSPDGALLATASQDRTVRVWQLATGTRLATFTGHKGAAMAVAFSPDGRPVASGGGFGTVRLWSVEAPPAPPDRGEL